MPVDLLENVDHHVGTGQGTGGAGPDWFGTGDTERAMGSRLTHASEHGTPLDGSNVTHRFQVALERAALPRQRFHDLRHACATYLLANGVSPRVVMETLGHSQISLTMNTYVHVAPEMGREAADRLEHALWGT